MTSLKSGEDSEFKVPNDRSKVPYYHINIDQRLVPETRELLEKYSHIPPEEQSKHVHEIRDKAWDIRAWPCIGMGSWLTPQLSHMPVYAEVLKRVKEGAVLVDVGTFLGHDLRRLVYNGAPSENLYGVDITNHYDVGYEFFRDREHFKGHFIEADILADNAPSLAPLHARVDIIVISQVLHQWSQDGQLKAAQNLVPFTKPGSIIVGNQVGNLEPRAVYMDVIPKSAWRHNPDSFAKLWDAVGAATGTQWETHAVLKDFKGLGWDEKDTAWMEPDARLIEFVARRIS